VKLLLDTHSFIWFVEGNPQLSLNSRELIADPENQVFLSIVSIWEMAIKDGLGKLDLRQPLNELVATQISLNDISVLPLTVEHALYVRDLPLHHRDPFDRIIIGQGIIEGLPVISIDEVFDRYGISRIW